MFIGFVGFVGFVEFIEFVGPVKYASLFFEISRAEG
jgi:hypothetical protein